MKKTIAIDIDEVLSASAGGLIAYSNKHWGTNLTVDDYSENWAKMWLITEEESNARAVSLRKEGIIRSYLPFSDALPVLEGLSKKYKLVVATSRNMHLSEDTIHWLNMHYKGLFDNIHHSGIYDGEANEERHLVTKAQLCKDIDADYLIDDQLKHCVGAAEIGVEAILFGDYAWNKTDTLPVGVTRCSDWKAVAKYFEEKSA